MNCWLIVSKYLDEFVEGVKSGDRDNIYGKIRNKSPDWKFFFIKSDYKIEEKYITMKNSATLCDTSTATAAILATSDSLQGCWIIYCTIWFCLFFQYFSVYFGCLCFFLDLIYFSRYFAENFRKIRNLYVDCRF